VKATGTKKLAAGGGMKVVCLGLVCLFGCSEGSEADLPPTGDDAEVTPPASPDAAAEAEAPPPDEEPTCSPRPR
jgi:hypothetical protein